MKLKRLIKAPFRGGSNGTLLSNSATSEIKIDLKGPSLEKIGSAKLTMAADNVQSKERLSKNQVYSSETLNRQFPLRLEDFDIADEITRIVLEKADAGDRLIQTLANGLEELGLLEFEAKFLARIFHEIIVFEGVSKNPADSFTSLLPYALRISTRASAVQFGFALFDINQDEKLSKAEFLGILMLFWDSSLENILKTKGGGEMLHIYLESQLCDELLRFYEAIRNKTLESQISLADALNIFETYIKEGAPFEVNISYEQREALRERIESLQENKEEYVDISIFEDSAEEVRRLIENGRLKELYEKLQHTDDISKKLLASIEVKQDFMTYAEFHSWLLSNRIIELFLRDIRRCVRRMRAVGKDWLRERRELSWFANEIRSRPNHEALPIHSGLLKDSIPTPRGYAPSQMHAPIVSLEQGPIVSTQHLLLV